MASSKNVNKSAKARKTAVHKKQIKHSQPQKAKKQTKTQRKQARKAKRTADSNALTQMIDGVVAEVAGRDVVQLVRVLRQKSNVSEFTLAEAIKSEINAVRNMLYRLQENNLVLFTRKKDKKKGWYIYYWTFNTPHVKDILRNLKHQKLDKLQERLQREKNTQFYVCYTQEKMPDGSVKRGPATMRLDFDTAINYGFKCPETGQLLELEDNSEKIRQLEKEIEDAKKEIEELKN